MPTACYLLPSMLHSHLSLYQGICRVLFDTSMKSDEVKVAAADQALQYTTLDENVAGI